MGRASEHADVDHAADERRGREDGEGGEGLLHDGSP